MDYSSFETWTVFSLAAMVLLHMHVERLLRIVQGFAQCEFLSGFRH